MQRRIVTHPVPVRLVPAAWLPTLLALGAATVALAWLFRAEVFAMVRTWETSTAYSHCWLILPIAIWLAWMRRRLLIARHPEPDPRFALLMAPAALIWFVADRLGIMEGRQFAVLGMLYVAILTIVGWRVCLAMVSPLLYLVFLVPFGAFTVPFLQSITARMVDLGLDLTGIPHYVDDLVIDVPAGAFYVAEACAGLRFAIAALAFGTLYALTMFRSLSRRLIVLLLAIVVPIVANGLRALGLVILGELQGSAAAIEADHILYGWVFFSIVMLLLIATGLPFKEDSKPRTSVVGLPAAPRPDTPRHGTLATATLSAAFLAGLGPLASAAIENSSDRTPREFAVALAAPGGCEIGPDGSLHCGTSIASARLLVFSREVTWDVVAAARRRATGGDGDEDVTFTIPIAGGGAWRARLPHGPRLDQPVAMASASWLDGRAAGDGLASRFRQAVNAFLPAQSGGPVVVIVELRGAALSDGRKERALMRDILDLQVNTLQRQAVQLSRDG